MSNLKKTHFGKNGPLVTHLGFGGIPIQTISNKEAVEVVRYAYEKGIRFFDTAHAYTTSEGNIGEALSDVRSSIFIATKSGSKDRDGIAKDFEQSLTSLKTDHVDLFMFHNIQTKDAFAKIMAPGGPYEYMMEMKARGAARMIGFSSHSVDASLLVAATGDFASLEFPYNYLEKQCVPELLPLLKKQGMGFIVMKPFAGGALKNATAALKWLFRQDYGVVIPGMMNKEQIDQAVATSLGSYEITPEEQDDIDEDIKMLDKNFCRRCQYCLPCPNGIAVNSVISAELLFNRSGWHKVNDQTIKMLKAGLECEKCGICESRCPYHLPLTTLVSETAARLLDKIEKMKQA